MNMVTTTKKLSHFIAEYLWDIGIRNVFGITGGASVHLLEAFEKIGNFNIVYNHHEQASAMGADAVWRLKNELGVCVATSGPGAMNLITGIASAYFDSIPMICLTGQVASFRSSENLGVRQVGFQETNIIEMVKPITKYAKKITSVENTIFEIEKSIKFAVEGRKGPVLIDIPDDFQRKLISRTELKTKTALKLNFGNETALKIDKFKLREVRNLLLCSEKPLIIAGAGLREGNSITGLLELSKNILCPIIPSWGMVDSFDSNNELVLDTGGTHGNRYTNLALQKADLLLILGSRLDSHFIGSPPANFAPNAKKILVDIDKGELSKFKSLGVNIDCPINADASYFLSQLKLEQITSKKYKVTHSKRTDWLSFIENAKYDLSDCKKRAKNKKYTNPYLFIEKLGAYCGRDAIICCDTGSILAWSMQAFKFSGNQRFIHAFNNTPMGYSIPATIASLISTPDKQTISLVGDGSFMMNIQELAVITKYKLPGKIFVISNLGYSMVRQTQEQWFNSFYFGSGSDDLWFPDFSKTANAFGFKYECISRNDKIEKTLQQVFSNEDAYIIEVKVDAEHRVIPLLKYGASLPDMEPKISKSLERKYSIK